MSPELIVTLTAVFLSTALLAGLFASTVLGRTAPELKRLRDVTRSSVETEGRGNGFQRHSEDPQAALSLRKSSGKSTRLTRRLKWVGMTRYHCGSTQPARSCCRFLPPPRCWSCWESRTDCCWPSSWDSSAT